MSHLKLSVLCICGVLLLAQYAPAAQNLVLNPGFETTSAEPNLVCADWTRTAANATGVSYATVSPSEGLDGSKALYVTTVGAAGDSSGSNGAWQIIPVVVGKKYQVHGQWKGDISIQMATSSSAMVEVYVGFGSSPTTRASSETCIYRKRNQYGSSNIYNVDPNGAVWNWRDISVSPNLGWGGDDTVTATNSYMTIRFNMSTGVQTGTEYLAVDNVVVEGCQAAIGDPDINSDCVVNFRDMAIIGTGWLTCGVAPSSLCW